MGFNAFVNCNCYLEGKTSEPHHKEYLRIDNEGIWLHTPNDLWKKDSSLVLKMDREFDEWLKTACEHENMCVANEWLTNYPGMSSFRYMIEINGGEEKFPVLVKYLPVANGGTLPPEFASAALNEIEELENSPSEHVAYLFDKSKQDDLMYGTNAERNTWIAMGGYHYTYTVGRDGFCIFDTRNNTEALKFSSSHFTQEKLDENKYVFVDIASGNHYQCCMGIHSEGGDSGIKEYEVMTKHDDIQDKYGYIFATLKKLLRASLQTNNPIIWC